MAIVGVFAFGPSTVANAAYDANPLYDTGDVRPRSWSFSLDTTDVTASYRLSFDATNDHVILTFGAPRVTIEAPWTKVWPRQVAGVATIIVHADGGR